MSSSRGFVDCNDKTPDQVVAAVGAAASKISNLNEGDKDNNNKDGTRSDDNAAAAPTIIVDSLFYLALDLGVRLPAFLLSLIGTVSAAHTPFCTASTSSPQAATTTATTTTTPSLFATYHTTLAIPPPSPHSPPIVTLLQHTATTVLSLHSPTQFLQKTAARLRSKPEPAFGLAESATSTHGGILVGLGSSCPHGVVLEADIRRRGSGRGLGGWYYLGRHGAPDPGPEDRSFPLGLMMLDDYPPYANLVRPVDSVNSNNDGNNNNGEKEQDDTDAGITFSLSLTDKQRRARDEVALPYFDAQRAAQNGGKAFDLSAIGDGGRILYEMGDEDDFDEEEDEI